MNIDGQKIKVVNNVVYLGVSISNDLCDDTDIARQVRYLYCAAKKLNTRFFKCSIEVKNILFRARCMCFYASQLLCNYSTSAINWLKVVYNDTYRILHGMSRYHRARKSQIQYTITLIRSTLYSVKLLINLLNAVTYLRTFGLKR